jgi:hypothetical protein
MSKRNYTSTPERKAHFLEVEEMLQTMKDTYADHKEAFSTMPIRKIEKLVTKLKKFLMTGNGSKEDREALGILRGEIQRRASWGLL